MTRRRHALTLRARLVAGIGVVATLLVVVLAAITVTTRAQLFEQVDARLASSAVGSRGVRPLDLAGTPPQPGPSAEAPQRPERLSDVYEGVIGPDGVLVTFFAPNVGEREYAPPDVTGDDVDDLAVGARRLFTTGSTDGAVTYRVLAERRDNRVVTVTALPVEDVQATVERLWWVMGTGTVTLLGALGLVAWWVVHLGIRPVKEMTHTATLIAEGDLTVRVPPARPGTESGELAEALNRMLGRIEQALGEQAAARDRLRRFVADASHELRTPVTTIQGYAELYRHGALGAPGDLDDAMRRTEAEALRMGRLVEDMLVLARFDEERPLALAPVDIAELGRDAVTDARAVSPGRPLAFEATGCCVVAGDEDRLRQVVANVVGNALVHTEPDVPVTVRVAGDGAAVVLEVTDQGPGMAPEVAERVTERFFRADASRSRHRGGSGLGLSIVDAAVAAHGGSLSIESAPGAGTTVRLRLPAAG